MKTLEKKSTGIFFALLFTVLLLFEVLMLPASAADAKPRLTDMADLLSDSEEADLLNQLDEISNRQQVDIVVVTANSLEGKTAMAYADDFYDQHDYGFGDEKDGILLLISMEERDWYISTTGYGITAFTDAGLEYISDKFTADLSDGDYMTAFTKFAELSDDFIAQAKTGTAYDTGNLPKEPFQYVRNFAIALVIAFILSLIITGFMKRQLKTVHRQPKADDYIKQDSMKLTKKNDLFLYKHVDCRKRAENSSSSHSGGSRTHTSSSGRTHGGRGGKF